MRTTHLVAVASLAMVSAVFMAVANTTAQDPQAVEAELGLDRPTRRLIQRGLSNEGFDPGAADGLFGPRTRDAVRRWQQARGVPATGYLDGGQADLLRAAVASPQPGSEKIEPPTVPAETAAPSDSASESAVGPTPTSGAPESVETSAGAADSTAALAAPATAAATCHTWNTEDFFEMATVTEVTACLRAGANLEARDSDAMTPLLWTARMSAPAIVKVLLAAGADVDARDGPAAPPNW